MKTLSIQVNASDLFGFQFGFCVLCEKFLSFHFRTKAVPRYSMLIAANNCSYELNVKYNKLWTEKRHVTFLNILRIHTFLQILIFKWICNVQYIVQKFNDLPCESSRRFKNTVRLLLLWWCNFSSIRINKIFCAYMEFA